jgi:hypothetical protein
MYGKFPPQPVLTKPIRKSQTDKKGRCQEHDVSKVSCAKSASAEILSRPGTAGLVVAGLHGRDL